MVLDLRQRLGLTQQLVMTPQLQMAIRLLQLNRLELVDAIQQELAENPALEESPAETDGEEQAEAEAEKTNESSAEKEVSIEDKITDQVEWENYLNEYNSYGSAQFESEEKEKPQFESFTASPRTLKDHLLWQFLMTRPGEEEERIASLIIGNINEDGYLEAGIEEIALAVPAAPEKVSGVLTVIKTFDPPGVGAANLAECLMIQLNQLGISNPVIRDIITHHLKDLENKNYKAITRALKIRLEEALAAISVIRNLEPRPGRQFREDEPRYIIPDIYVYKHENDFVIVLNDDDLPRLNINPYYRKAVQRNSGTPREAKEYLRERIRSASWLIKSIQQRRKTIYNVMQSILKFQRDFFDYGIAHLKPMILRDVADDIGMHESTISRVTTNKYAHTPQGVFELKYFFNSSINRLEGESMASASVQEQIRQIIKSENTKKPYSDDKIAAMLKQSGIDIARRTVTKYREVMAILPSTKRKQF
ncbi:MAG: RNA polymerase factor sigma-54 [Thermodesulfobacteriota bacterium]